MILRQSLGRLGLESWTEERVYILQAGWSGIERELTDCPSCHHQPEIAVIWSLYQYRILSVPSRQLMTREYSFNFSCAFL